MTEDDSSDSVMIGGRGGASAADRPARDPNEQAAAFAQRLLDSQTPEQAAIARQIYGRMRAGADVADVRELIDRLCATRTRGRQPEAPVTPVRDHEIRLFDDE